MNKKGIIFVEGLLIVMVTYSLIRVVVSPKVENEFIRHSGYDYTIHKMGDEECVKSLMKDQGLSREEAEKAISN